MPSLDNEQREVDFNIWCSQCIYKDRDEENEPCNSCLAEGVNAESSKPFEFKSIGTPIALLLSNEEKRYLAAIKNVFDVE